MESSKRSHFRNLQKAFHEQPYEMLEGTLSDFTLTQVGVWIVKYGLSIVADLYRLRLFQLLAA